MQGCELICVGNAIVDIMANVEDKLLLKLKLIKGSMKIVSNQEFNQILKEDLDTEKSILKNRVTPVK